MKLTTKRILSLLFVLVLMLSAVTPAFAYERIQYTTGKYYVYLEKTKLGGSALVEVPIVRGYGEPVLLTDAKSIRVIDKSAGATFYQLSTYGNEYISRPEGSTSLRYTYPSWRDIVTLKVKHSGSAKVTYTVDGKKYSVMVYVKPYVNPVKSITLTGVNKGNSFHARTKSDIDGLAKPLKLPQDVKSATLSVKPIKGWKVISVAMQASNSGIGRNISYSNGMNSVTLNWGKLSKNEIYYIYAGFRNTATGALQFVKYMVRN